MLKEFKEFAMKGNVIDLATGVIIGAAFGKIVTSLVNDVIMPVFSLFTGQWNISELAIQLNEKTTLNYGQFISNIIDFLIIAFSIFIIIKQINRFKPKPKAVEPTTKACPYCQSTIHIKAVKCPNCTSDIK